jgi:hypothetical protein
LYLQGSSKRRDGSNHQCNDHHRERRAPESARAPIPGLVAAEQSLAGRLHDYQDQPADK